MAFNLLKTNCMIDLETLSTRYDAGILSIGAVKFDHQGIQDKFYASVKLKSTVKHGLHISQDTLNWWAEQRGDVINSIFENADTLDNTLESFSEWYGKDSLETWGNGADFDIVIMSTAYERVEKKVPWHYRKINCFRTMKGLIDPDGGLVPPKNENAHNALADAEWQALWAINMWKAWAGEIESV